MDLSSFRGVVMKQNPEENGLRGFVRHLAIYLWHETDASAVRLNAVLAAGTECGVECVWNAVLGQYGVAPLEEAEKRGAEIEQAYRGRRVSILCPGDGAYPTSLYSMSAPPILSVRGDVSFLKKAQIAIVGSRKTPSEARRIGEMIAFDVMERGYVVTSGGALGVDGVAHRAAMGRLSPTIVVSAVGPEVVYPKENADIFEYAGEFGAVVSQFADKPAFRPNFPMRNDVIAALGDATIVVQSRVDGGALYTARAAHRMKRPVFVAALQGFDDRTEGGLLCVKSGMARLLSQCRDLDCLGRQRQLPLFEPEGEGSSGVMVRLPPTQMAIFQALSKSAATREVLRADLGFPVDFDEAILELELSGSIRNIGGKFARA